MAVTQDGKDFTTYLTKKPSATAVAFYDWLAEVVGYGELDLKSVALATPLRMEFQASKWWAENKDSYRAAHKPVTKNEQRLLDEIASLRSKIAEVTETASVTPAQPAARRSGTSKATRGANQTAVESPY